MFLDEIFLVQWMANIAEMWRDVHVHGAYCNADMWMAATICRRPKLPGLYRERTLFFIRLFPNRDLFFIYLGRLQIVAAIHVSAIEYAPCTCTSLHISAISAIHRTRKISSRNIVRNGVQKNHYLGQVLGFFFHFLH